MCCGCDTSYIVAVHIQCQTFIYTLSLCRGHSWRVRLAKQETLTPPGHLVSPLLCRGPWMPIVVLYCWCHSDSASVLLYFTYMWRHRCAGGLKSWVWVYWCLTSHVMIFQSYMWRHSLSPLVFNVTYVTAQMCRRTEEFVPTIGLPTP